jgi:hypothetical protein
MRQTITSLVLAGLLLGSQAGAQETIMEPARKVPVLYDADVVVAGGGIAGVFAAIAAAREGARAVLIEKFEYVGGAAGPGLNVSGGHQEPGLGPLQEYEQGRTNLPYVWVYPELRGIPQEFAQRLNAMLVGKEWNSLERSNLWAYVATKMLQEANVTLLLGTYASDPIMDGDTVHGLFVESKSGRGAVRAKIVIDATGEADVARRAGAPILMPKAEYSQLDSHAPTGIGTWAYVSGYDYAAHAEGMKALGGKLPEFKPYDIGGLAQVVVWDLDDRATPMSPRGITSLKIQLVRPHPQVDAGDALHMSALQAGVRMYVNELVQELRKLPGCEGLYLVALAPYLGIRGGPCIEGEYTLTMDDCIAGRQFDDVMYLLGEIRAMRATTQAGQCKWVDVPYRVMVPKRIDGLLAVGRSASGIPDTLLRNRMAVQHMGQAAGTAAAMAARQGIQPRNLDVKALQRRLLECGFYLGDQERLRDLGLVTASQTSQASASRPSP